MKKITKSECCFECKTCCKYSKELKEYGPILTLEEMNKVIKKLNNKNDFKKHNGSKNVFRIKLKKSNTEKNTYTCPLLVEETQECKIYDIQPLHCELWPFTITRDKHNSINIFCYEKSNCPCLEELKEGEFENYKKYIIEMLNSEKYKKLLKEYPALAWPEEEDDDVFYVGSIEL